MPWSTLTVILTRQRPLLWLHIKSDAMEHFDCHSHTSEAITMVTYQIRCHGAFRLSFSHVRGHYYGYISSQMPWSISTVILTRQRLLLWLHIKSDAMEHFDCHSHTSEAVTMVTYQVRCHGALRLSFSHVRGCYYGYISNQMSFSHQKQACKDWTATALSLTRGQNQTMTRV